jgi:hypothetical protein
MDKLLPILKDGIFLDVWSQVSVDHAIMAKLFYIIKYLNITTGEFSFPNRNFEKFEADMKRAKLALDKEFNT